MSEKREFTGVFIPAHIWTCTELIPAEKMLLGEISALSVRTGWCEASRDHFASWLQCDVSNVSKYTSKLEKMGFVEVMRTPGERSKIRVVGQRFYTEVPVNPIHGGSEPHSRGVVNPIHGGSEPHSREIKEKEKKKYNSKDSLSAGSGSRNEISTVKKESEAQTLPPHSAPPPPPADPAPGRVLTNSHGTAHLPKAYTTVSAKIFDEVVAEKANEHGLNIPTYNWKAKPAIDMRDMKAIVEMIALTMTEARASVLKPGDKVEITEEGIVAGIKYLFQQAFEYAVTIAGNTDGRVTAFGPGYIRRNYNGIVQFAKANRVPKHSQRKSDNREQLKDNFNQFQQSIRERLGLDTSPAHAANDVAATGRIIHV